MRRLLSVAALGLALPPATAAAAQSNVRPVDETAADLAYGLCPLFLAGQLTLTDPQLADRGFSTEVKKVQYPALGEISIVRAELADGGVTFGGIAGARCLVLADGPDHAKAWATLHANMAYMGLDFALDPKHSSKDGGTTMEVYRAPAGDQFLYVQLIASETPNPLASAQLFVMDQ